MPVMAGILAKRYRNGQLEYEVEWVGREKTTWMPATYNFAPQFLGDFEHRQKKQRAERQLIAAAQKRLARNPFLIIGQKASSSSDDKSDQPIPMDVDGKIDVLCIGTPKGRCDISAYVAEYKRHRMDERRYDFSVSLEDIFVGGFCKAPVRGPHVSAMITVFLSPGSLAGTERDFDLPDGTTITLVVRDKPHKSFRREGSDLHHTHRLPLKEALLGATVRIFSFTGELVVLSFDEPVPHGSTKRIPEKGFPLPEDPAKRGDLVVTFDVVFPDHVDEEYHKDIKRLL